MACAKAFYITVLWALSVYIGFCGPSNRTDSAQSTVPKATLPAVTLNPYDANPAASNCLAAFKELEPLPGQLTAFETKLKENGEYLRACAYEMMATAVASWGSACSHLASLEVMYGLVTDTNYYVPSTALLFSTYANLQMTIKSFRDLHNVPAFNSLSEAQQQDLNQILLISQGLVNIILQPAIERFTRSNPGLTWDEFVRKTMGLAVGETPKPSRQAALAAMTGNTRSYRRSAVDSPVSDPNRLQREQGEMDGRRRREQQQQEEDQRRRDQMLRQGAEEKRLRDEQWRRDQQRYRY
jgi:hypothetical protein